MLWSKSSEGLLGPPLLDGCEPRVGRQIIVPFMVREPFRVSPKIFVVQVCYFLRCCIINASFFNLTTYVSIILFKPNQLQRHIIVIGRLIVKNLRSKCFLDTNLISLGYASLR